jgi:hypothetical protein
MEMHLKQVEVEQRLHQDMSLLASDFIRNLSKSLEDAKLAMLTSFTSLLNSGYSSLSEEETEIVIRDYTKRIQSEFSQGQLSGQQAVLDAVSSIQQKASQILLSSLCDASAVTYALLEGKLEPLSRGLVEFSSEAPSYSEEPECDEIDRIMRSVISCPLAFYDLPLC